MTKPEFGVAAERLFDAARLLMTAAPGKSIAYRPIRKCGQAMIHAGPTFTLSCPNNGTVRIVD